MALINLTSTTFDESINSSDKPVVVDFWAEWCGPCKMIAPILDEVSKDYSEKVQIAKINVDENQGVPAKFGIRGIPTLIFLKGGKLVDQIVGNPGKDSIAQMIQKHQGALLVLPAPVPPEIRKLSRASIAAAKKVSISPVKEPVLTISRVVIPLAPKRRIDSVGPRRANGGTRRNWCYRTNRSNRWHR